jgi:hypothetical protein
MPTLVLSFMFQFFVFHYVYFSFQFLYVNFGLIFWLSNSVSVCGSYFSFSVFLSGSNAFINPAY